MKKETIYLVRGEFEETKDILQQITSKYLSHLEELKSKLPSQYAQPYKSDVDFDSMYLLLSDIQMEIDEIKELTKKTKILYKKLQKLKSKRENNG